MQSQVMIAGQSAPLKVRDDMVQKQQLLCKSRIVLDGITCTISVRLKHSVHYARWFCGGCSDRSEAEFREQTAEGVIEAAKVDWLAHLAKPHARRT